MASPFREVQFPAKISITVGDKENNSWGMHSNFCTNLKVRNAGRKQLENEGRRKVEEFTKSVASFRNLFGTK